MPEKNGVVTELIQKAAGGNEEAKHKLFDLVHEELRKIAKARLSDQTPDNSVQTGELVGDAFRKLEGFQVNDRKHFYRVAALAMRQILVDRARARRKRHEKHQPLPGHEAEMAQPEGPDLIALDDALRRFEELDPRAAEVVQLRFFSQHTIKATAEILGVAEGTVKNDWNAARAWLRRELSNES